MAKALDRLSLGGLLLKIKSYGSANPLYRWLISHLSGRSQVVSIIGTLSQCQPMSGGVIHGSIFGDSLFAHYLNVFLAIGHDTPPLFGDDTKIVYYL